MSLIDIKALETNFEDWRKERVPSLSISKAFERFAIEQILKDADLTDEELASGILGGDDDGGVDGMYFFVNRLLIQEETDLPDPALSVHLYIIQAKYETGFAETPVQKLESFARDLLNYASSVDSLVHLNTSVREAISMFRQKYDSILGSQHSLHVTFAYATKSDQDANPKVVKRVESLVKFVQEQLSAAVIDFQYWSCQRLLSAARTSPKRQLSVEVTKQFMTDDNCAVCLVNLKKFALFLTDELGLIRRSMLEPNVRDYQGKGNLVNKDIRKTLGSTGPTEFWWLNNGITILATSCSLTGNKLTVEKPEVVNGLQTSQEIYRYFEEHRSQAEARNVLIRVIVAPDEQVRSKITKATNFQTTVAQVSLHATDQIHFDIEDKLRLYDLFYDRRKGEYRELRKPVQKIISIRTLARAVIAIVLRRPDDARARPQSLLNNDTTYSEIFNDSHNRDLYVVCILIDRKVDAYLASREDIKPDAKTDVKYYVDMWLICDLLNNATPTARDIAALLPVVGEISVAQLTESSASVLAIYKRLGATDKVAKGTDMRKAVSEALTAKFPLVAPLAKATGKS